MIFRRTTETDDLQDDALMPVGARTGARGQLAPDGWRMTPAVNRLFSALDPDRRSGPGSRVRFVGGCVRDSIRRRPVTDIDIATVLSPEAVMRRLEDAGIDVHPTGVAHGTVTAVIDRQPFEITTLRHDVRTDGRHAEVAFTEDWVADAARRDFTINAMSADIDGAVFDYFDGLADLGAGRVRFVGHPQTRIREDRLRILRFFRFHAHYAKGRPDAAAMAACRAEAAGLRELSAERVRTEMFKIFGAPDPVDTLLSMREAGALAEVLPEAMHFGRLRQTVWLVRRGLAMDKLKLDPLRRLAALLPQDPAIAGTLAERWRLSNAERDRLAAMLDPDPFPAEPPIMIAEGLSDRDVQRALLRGGRALVIDRILLAWAAARDGETAIGAVANEAWRDLLTRAFDLPVPEFPLSGDDVLAAGVAPGPDVGAALAHLRAAWEESGFALDRAALLHRLAVSGGKGV